MVAIVRAVGVAIFSAVVAMLASPASAQQASEAAVKAAFLYKFPGYIEWPEAAFAGPDSPFVIGPAS